MTRKNYTNLDENSTIYTDSNTTGYVGTFMDDDDYAPTHPAKKPQIVGETEIIGDNVTQIDDLLSGSETPQTVGWLICVKGTHKGKDFHLHNGWNYIGRSPKSDVCVDDPKISSTMARVSYDARNRAFAISTSEGAKNLTYCNNKAVYNTVEINAYDVISMGDTDFIFVPLCGPHFTWEE